MDPNVCPVCTLYLREGITLHSHLNTHPKDQVIEALVRCASLRVPSSIANENGELISESVSSAHSNVESQLASVHHYGSPLQAVPTVPSSGPVSVSSPYSIGGPLNLSSSLSSHNGLGAPNAEPNAVHPIAIGLAGSSGNQYASTFAYQQFCGGGDGTFLVAMSPQQQYAAYSSSSSSSSNSVLQMVFNPYAVDPVIGNPGYAAPGLITGIGLGPTLQTCQQVQTNVLQQVVTASPLVATSITPMNAERHESECISEGVRMLSSDKEPEVVKIPVDQVTSDRQRIECVDTNYSVQDLDCVLSNPSPCGSKMVVEKVPLNEEEPINNATYPLRRSMRRGRNQTKIGPKSCISKQIQTQSSKNESSSSSELASTSSKVVDLSMEGSRKGSGKILKPKQITILDYYKENPHKVEDVRKSSLSLAEDSPLVSSERHQSKENEDIIEVDGSSEVKQNEDIVEVEDSSEDSSRLEVCRSETPNQIKNPEKGISKVEGQEEWVDITSLPASVIQEDAREDVIDDPFHSEDYFESDEVDQNKSESCCQTQSPEENVFMLNQWSLSEENQQSENGLVVSNTDSEKQEKNLDVQLKNVEGIGNEGKILLIEESIKEKESQNGVDAKCNAEEAEIITTGASEVGPKVQKCTEQSAIEDDEVIVVERGENATLEPEKDWSQNEDDNCREVSPIKSPLHVRPAPGDTDDALPAPPSPVNIFQIDGMSIILSSRLIEQTDKMRERLGIFESLGPVAGSFSDISIPEGILEEEGLVSDIRANEAMPPRGELSGQEGMGSVSNYGDPGMIEDDVPKPEGTTIWTSGGFSLFPASARQGATQADQLLLNGENWTNTSSYKNEENNVGGTVSETTTMKKRQRSKKSCEGSSKATSNASKMKTKRLYHCWNCLEVFNCPKERRVHQKEKHNGEKSIASKMESVMAPVEPVQLKDQDEPVDLNTPEMKNVEKEDNTHVKGSAELEETNVTIGVKGEKGAETSHPCSDCDRSFPSLRSLTAHRRAAHRDSRYKCPTCMEKFLTSVDFTNHVRTVHPLECSMCGKQFSRQQNLRLHLKRHLSVRPYKCTQCDKAFVTNQKMEEHLNSHTGRTPFQCPLCPRAFRRHSNLIQHRKHHHMKVKRKVRDFFCHCGAVFHSVKKLEWHKETHEDKPKTCPHCSDRFIHKAGLTRHIRQVHDKRYVPSGAKEDVNVECPVCSAVYLKSSLHIHMRVHSGERPFSCGICGKCFATKWNLQLHRWVHASPHSKPFKCATCKAAYHRRVDYVAHIRSHGKVRPYVCNFCGRRFMRKYNCLRHSREHETGKKFECSICHKRFHRRYYLKEHLRIHTGLRPYVCHVCGKASGTKSNMNKHVRIHHAREPVNTEG